jgi:hypothetical protein
MPLFLKYCVALPLIFTITTSAAQKAGIRKLATVPKKNIELPLDYAILLPRLNIPDWNRDNKAYNHFITPAVVQSQPTMSFRKDGIDITWNMTSAFPHAQLDTSTLITDTKQLIGTWRSVSYRTINFRDSFLVESGEFLRNNALVGEHKGDDVFLKMDNEHFMIYRKAEGEKDFGRDRGIRYNLQSGRYLLLYRRAKRIAGLLQAGIDKEGRLILHAADVQVRKLGYNYFVYEAVINQTVYERISE